jgi:hypothetical protein
MRAKVARAAITRGEGMRLENRIAIVTGGTSGIGRRIVVDGGLTRGRRASEVMKGGVWAKLKE